MFLYILYIMKAIPTGFFIIWESYWVFCLTTSVSSGISSFPFSLSTYPSGFIDDLTRIYFCFPVIRLSCFKEVFLSIRSVFLYIFWFYLFRFYILLLLTYPFDFTKSDFFTSDLFSRILSRQILQQLLLPFGFVLCLFGMAIY